MSLPTIRTITLGLEQPHPLPLAVLQQAAQSLRQVSVRYQEQGYTVQTVRLATRPFLEDLAGWSAARILAYALELQRRLYELGLEYCSLGTVFATRPDFDLAQLDLLADILSATEGLSVTVHLATPEEGLRAEAALPIARIIQRLARETIEGFGNFRFAMLACVPAGSPFFPTAYHRGPTSIALGLQGAALVQEAIEQARSSSAPTPSATSPLVPLPPQQITHAVSEALTTSMQPVVALAQQYVQEQHLHFKGLDLSPAPMGEISIASAIEACGYGPLGASGTLTAVGALTAALKSVPLPLCGYNGLMLPVLEDAILGQRWAEGRVNAQQLLLYSAVCGTGLDTIPLPGESDPALIARILLDVATLAVRYQKPLSARLFPVPGRQSGEQTYFTSPYLTNTRICQLG